MSLSPIRLPIGLSDFRELREGGFVYVDKTALITDVLDESAQVMLAPRPRRFGKTLALSMLRCFFEKPAPALAASRDASSPEPSASSASVRSLFDGLAVASSKSAWAHFQRYPVIFMTFKDVKPRSWEDCLDGVANVLAKTFDEHRYLLTDGGLDAEDARFFAAILDRRATKSQLVIAVELLSVLLARRHRERVVILIDEYDAPIHAGYTNKYYDDVIAFFRDFLSGGLKDSAHLFKGVLTGVLRVARESLFSGLNNVEVYSLLREQLATGFGFTEPEVRVLAEAAGQADAMDGIRDSYNGYLFGGQAIYNPWSVLSFLNRGDRVFRPYWIETSSNDLVRELLITGPEGVKGELETLLAGGALDKPIDENIVLRDVSSTTEAVWSFLLFTGYLKATEVRYVETLAEATLVIPNREVASAIRRMVQSWFVTAAGGSEHLQRLFDALLGGDAPVVERQIARIVEANTSFFDAARPEPERFYHGLVVGLLAGLHGRYDVRSNRESGYGRCDVMVSPKAGGQPGVILELKTVDTERGETAERAIRAALKQIRERDYAAELRERGAAPIHLMAVVFEGKRVHVRAASASEKKPARSAKPKPRAKSTPERRAAPRATAKKKKPKAGSNAKPKRVKSATRR